MLQSSYWVLGHFSRFMPPGARVLATSGGGTAETYSDFEAVRNYTVSCARRACPPAAGLPLLSVGFVVPSTGAAGVVVANVNGREAGFKLSDARGKRAALCSIPGESIQTYTFSA